MCVSPLQVLHARRSESAAQRALRRRLVQVGWRWIVYVFLLQVLRARRSESAAQRALRRRVVQVGGRWIVYVFLLQVLHARRSESATQRALRRRLVQVGGRRLPLDRARSGHLRRRHAVQSPVSRHAARPPSRLPDGGQRRRDVDAGREHRVHVGQGRGHGARLGRRTRKSLPRSL